MSELEVLPVEATPWYISLTPSPSESAGLPVVASNVSGLEPYRDSEWITLIPLGDDIACNNALRTLCELPLEERQRLGALAREEAEYSMSWEKCTESLHKMLLEVKR